jgi:signal peptidase I
VTSSPSTDGGPASARAGQSRTGRAALRYLGARAAAILAPGVGAALILRYLVPSRLSGARGGLCGAVARIADDYPLFVGLALFLALAEAGGYWRRRGREAWGAATCASATDSNLAIPREPRVRSVGRVVAALVAIAAAVFVFRSSIAGVYRISGPSMLPTLEVGDRVLVDRTAYGVAPPLSHARIHRQPVRLGDLIVFRAASVAGATGADAAQSIVKRVIGLPGDRIAFRDGRLLVNDWPVPSCDAGPYTYFDGRLTVRGRLTVEFLGDAKYLTVRKPVEAPFAGYSVPVGEVFVLGDDRGLSSDSRIWNEGRGAGVRIDAIEGRVARVLAGARADGRLDLSRILSPPLGLRVRMPGIDTRQTADRIASCLRRSLAFTYPPPPRPAS